MHKVRKLVLAASLAALTATSLAVPASAATGKAVIGVISGIPGVRVDICINGKEIRSNVKYGGRTYKVVFPGTKKVQVRKASYGKCKGKVLGSKTMAFVADSDHTIVFNKYSPKAVVFDNTGLGVIPPGGLLVPGTAYWAWRHAADLGTVTMKYGVGSAIAPAADPEWVEGDQVASDYSALAVMGVLATRPDRSKILAKGPLVILDESRRYEWYLLGTSWKNAKFILWIRDIVQPAP